MQEKILKKKKGIEKLSLFVGDFPHGGSQLEILKEQLCPQFKKKQLILQWL